MTRAFLVRVAMLGVLGAAACGGSSMSSSASSCDLRTSAMYCQEYVSFAASTLAPYKSACTGTWSDSGCTRAGAVGGCKTTSSIGDVVNWFYAGGPYADAAAVMAACSQSSSTFVAP